jgi:amidase
MNRRSFVINGFQAGAAVYVGAILQACNSEEQGRTLSDEVFDLEEFTVDALQSGMKDGTLTSYLITKNYLKRIETLDHDGPSLHSVIEINPDALEIAKLLDEERKSKGPRGPMHGIPVLIKDNIDTADKMQTTAGSMALIGSIAPKDAYIVKLLREAGAVILGKTNLSEWANFRSTRSSSGWSSRGGQTKNPYALNCSPCGSSSGSGVAVAANLCAVAIGTETDGSIICPSALNGIVGIKPTIGLVSRSGIIPISHSQDTAGPMARTVRDATILLNTITGFDAADAAMKERPRIDYTSALNSEGLRGMRIGVLRNRFGVHEKVDEIMENSLSIIEKSGATLIELENLGEEGFGEAEFEVLLYEFKDGINKYLATLGTNAPVKNLEDLIAFNNANKEKTMPWFGQEIFEMAAQKGTLEDAAYQAALAKSKRLAGADGIDSTMKKHQLDAIAAPADSLPWSIDLINGDHYLMVGKASYSPAAVAGYPNITVPAGFANGMPVGISFFGSAFSEAVLIKIAYAFEQATLARRAPEFLERPV